MKKIRFVFYKAKFEWRNVFIKGRKIHLVDDLVALGTWLPNLFTPRYSHVETWIADLAGDFETVDYGGFLERVFVGTCYTSTMRGDANGTVSRPASEVFTHPERWEYLEFEVTDESFKTALLWAQLRVLRNKGYSKRDLLRFAMPLWMLKKLHLDDPDREICSEHGEGWATRLLVLAKPYGVTVIHKYILQEILIRSPRRLWRDLVRRHHVATYSLATGLMVRDEKGKNVKA